MITTNKKTTEVSTTSTYFNAQEIAEINDEVNESLVNHLENSF